MKIVTSLYLDRKDLSKNPQLAHLDYQKKRLTYWQCCITFFYSSLRLNPREKHVLYTNDTVDGLPWRGKDIKEFIAGLGVTIKYLPLEFYQIPPKYSTYLFGAFYKLEVLKALKEEADDESICLLDSDCIWIKPCEAIKERISQNNILLYDVYKIADLDVKKHGISRRDMYNFFSAISPGYTNVAPVRFGGEIVACNSQDLKILSDNLESEFMLVMDRISSLPKFENGKKFLDGMEFFSSYVYNKIPIRWKDSGDILKRIWTTADVNNVSEDDVNLVIWHLIAEKSVGIPLLSQKILDQDPEHTETPDELLYEYFGGFVGIPERRVSVKKTSFMRTLIPRAKNKIREKIPALGGFFHR